jgi:hypothetical protein
VKSFEYLAIPYTHKDEAVMSFRAEISDIICADLMMQGRYVFAPISSCHHIAKKYGLPRDWEFWKGMDEVFVSLAKKFLIVTLPGWEDSTGVMAELDIAKKHNIPIEYIDPTSYIEKLKGN